MSVLDIYMHVWEKKGVCNHICLYNTYKYSCNIKNFTAQIAEAVEYTDTISAEE